VIFLRWFSLRSFKYNFKNWLFPLLVIISGLMLLNVTLVMVSTGNSIIDETFLNNKNLKLLMIEPSRTSEKVMLRQIARNNNPDIVAYPYMNAMNTQLSFERGEEQLQNFGIPLPYEALAVLEIEGIDKERWDNGEIIIVPFEFASKFNINVGNTFSIPFQKTEVLMNDTTFDSDFETGVGRIIAAYEPRHVEVVALADVPLSKFPDTGIVPLNLYYDVQAASTGKSVEEYIATQSSQDGMGVLVKEFDDIEKTVKNFTDRQYEVTYALSDFKNMTGIVRSLTQGMNLFVFVVSLIIIVTIMNSLFQMFFYKKREIGLLMAMGIEKKVIIASYLIEIILQNIIVCLIIIPVVIMLQKIGLDQFATLDISLQQVDNFAELVLHNMYFNVGFVFSTTFIASLLPFVQTFRKTIVKLIN